MFDKMHKVCYNNLLSKTKGGKGVVIITSVEQSSLAERAGIRGGDVLVVRGRGKFIIRSLDERTAKGRLRLLADKYC